MTGTAGNAKQLIVLLPPPPTGLTLPPPPTVYLCPQILFTH